jgi:Kef-type K+ transport system membrane component KefB
LFLFLIGAQLDPRHLLQQRSTALLASSMSILLPFLLAVGLAPALGLRFAPAGISSHSFVLFLGISMSITAFPVLARILEERGLQATELGTTALLCAAVDDVCAWLLLAVGLALLPHAGVSMAIPVRLLWLALYLFLMLVLVRPAIAWFARRQSRSDTLSYEMLAVIIAILLISAAATNAIGIHPLFGAFLAGVCLPRVQHWQISVRSKLETIVSILLLPLFFALTGIRTRLDLLNGLGVWLWTVVVLLASVIGKMGGTMLAARWAGQPWRQAAALGALLNTRGLVELIVLNIAYGAHVFSPTLFTMLVVMAIFTTMITSPLLDLLGIDDQSGK